MDYRLRAVDLADAPELMALMRRIYPPIYAHLWEPGGMEAYFERSYAPEVLRRDLTLVGADYHFVDHGGAAVGILYTIGGTGPHLRPDPSAMKLSRIYLDPVVQGRGLGSALMQVVDERARSKDYASVWLEAMAGQVAALEFYERHRYRLIEHFALEAPLVRPSQAGMVRYVKVLRRD